MGCFPSNRKKTYPSPSVVQVSISPPEPRLVGSTAPQSQTSKQVIITSKYLTVDIRSLDYTPQNSYKNTVRYTCPVCLKFLSTVLVSECCHNYLCHYCAEELRKKEEAFDVRCPLCNAQPLVLTDVDQTAPIKRYSDSPISTFGAGKSNQGQKWVSPLVVVEEEQKLGMEGEDLPRSERGPSPPVFDLLRNPAVTQ